MPGSDVDTSAVFTYYIFTRNQMSPTLIIQEKPELAVLKALYDTKFSIHSKVPVRARELMQSHSVRGS